MQKVKIQRDEKIECLICMDRGVVQDRGGQEVPCEPCAIRKKDELVQEQKVRIMELEEKVEELRGRLRDSSNSKFSETRDYEDDMMVVADAFFDNLERDTSEYGAIGVNCKRPFGDGDVEGSILRMLEIEPPDVPDADWTAEQRRYVASLYDDLVDWLPRKWKELTEE